MLDEPSPRVPLFHRPTPSYGGVETPVLNSGGPPSSPTYGMSRRRRIHIVSGVPPDPSSLRNPRCPFPFRRGPRSTGSRTPSPCHFVFRSLRVSREKGMRGETGGETRLTNRDPGASSGVPRSLLCHLNRSPGYSSRFHLFRLPFLPPFRTDGGGIRVQVSPFPPDPWSSYLPDPSHTPHTNTQVPLTNS